MINELRYQVRSREIVDLISAMRSQRLVLTPYFQRNLVWRDAHKRDFIDTILKGYPFPQIFLARGPINLERMEASQCVVDGQQRLNTIMQFVQDDLEVDGKCFSDLGSREKEDFLKYEVPVIDFDLDAGDGRLKEVFHRLNRTYYSLTAIERISSEYSASEFLLVARVLSGEITSKKDGEVEDILSDDDEGNARGSNDYERDPGINESTWLWLMKRADGPYSELIAKSPVFSKFEFDRKVPLMFTLNIMCTYIAGYFNRNDKVRRFLDDYNDVFFDRDEVIDAINNAAAWIEGMNLPHESIWWNKANFFTLMCELSRRTISSASPDEMRSVLLRFAEEIPPAYALAMREAVGRKRERETRANMIRDYFAVFG